MTDRPRRRPFWAVTISVAVGSLVVGLVAGHFVRSPAQVAADTAPPPRTTLTAPVEKRVIESVIAFAGNVEASSTTRVTFASASDAEAPVVNAVRVRAGDEVKAGQVIAEVGGRPVVIVKGTTAAYRSMGPGMEGSDISALQDALDALGYPNGDDDGTYGSGTAQAVSEFYADRGFEATTQGREEVDAADEAVLSAQRALEDARAAAEQPDVAAGGESAVATSDNESADGSHGQVQVERAREDLSRAKRKRAAAAAAAGARVPYGEVVFVPSLPATVDSVEVAAGDPVGEGNITLVSGDPVVRGAVADADAEPIRAKASAHVLTTGTGDIEGTVTSIGPARTQNDSAAGGEQPEATSGSSGSQTQVEVTPKDPAALDDVDLGTACRVVVTVSATDTDVLAVPEAAVVTAADGRSHVTVLEAAAADVADEKRREVPVTTGAGGSGMVEVRPEKDTSLDPGEQVVLGVSEDTELGEEQPG